MEAVDVSPYNLRLHQYLRAESQNGRGGYGCKTQIRLEFLRHDGYHIRPQYDSVVDQTYACAMLGKNVPCPTPDNEFIPTHARRRWEREWPSLGGAGVNRSVR